MTDPRNSPQAAEVRHLVTGIMCSDNNQHISRADTEIIWQYAMLAQNIDRVETAAAREGLARGAKMLGQTLTQKLLMADQESVPGQAQRISPKAAVAIAIHAATLAIKDGPDSPAAILSTTINQALLRAMVTPQRDGSLTTSNAHIELQTAFFMGINKNSSAVEQVLNNEHALPIGITNGNRSVLLDAYKKTFSGQGIGQN